MGQDTPTKAPQQVFANCSIGIVTEADNLGEILKKAFENRGGQAQVFSMGKKAVDVARNDGLDILVVSDDVKYYDANWISKQVRVGKSIEIPVLWYIGKKPVPRFDGYIPKPFRPIELLKPIFTALKKHRATSDSPKEHRVKRIDKKKIVLIDDEEGLRDLGEMILEKNGYDVHTASNGKDGLKVVADNPSVSLILVDLKMPKMNGFEFVSTLRAMKAIPTCPIVVVTAFTNKATLKQGKKLRINAWITKPYDNNKLIETVKKLVGDDEDDSNTIEYKAS